MATLNKKWRLSNMTIGKLNSRRTWEEWN